MFQGDLVYWSYFNLHVSCFFPKILAVKNHAHLLQVKFDSLVALTIHCQFAIVFNEKLLL